MVNKDFYKASEVPQFQEEVCKKTCIMKGKCIEDGQNSHWFLMCPHYHRWKFGYTNFVIEQLEYDRTHLDEVKARHDAVVARAIAWKEERKRLKKEAKNKTKKDLK